MAAARTHQIQHGCNANKHSSACRKLKVYILPPERLRKQVDLNFKKLSLAWYRNKIGSRGAARAKLQTRARARISCRRSISITTAFAFRSHVILAFP